MLAAQCVICWKNYAVVDVGDVVDVGSQLYF